mmetsp:Transcript_19534/g.17292  ORF Transcript_19534/g.17292 Transcript_19534/m.17292 type:complete len:98 (+) Transcript_19534:355-648(+)
MSEEVNELGTLKYLSKYEAVIIEIINYHSHLLTDITIFTKDIYIEDGVQDYLNMSCVKFTSHPDYLEQERHAVLVSTLIKQPQIYSFSTRFYLFSKF